MTTTTNRPTAVDEATLPVSVCITTKNNADTIRRTLESVDEWTDEIVIVDSNSQDGTIEICEEYDANVYQHEFQGFAELKMTAMDHARNDWIFLLDADEAVPPDLRDTILAQFGTDDTVAYYLKKRDFILGQWTHQHHRKRPLLAKRDAVHFKQNYVWERLAVNEAYTERTKTLSRSLNHYNTKRTSEVEKKYQQYSALEAIHIVETDKRGDAATLLAKGFGVACYRLTINRGVLDGYRGFFMAFMDVYSKIASYAKIRDIHRLKMKHPDSWQEIWLEEECQR